MQVNTATILDLAERRGTFRKVAGTQGGEWHGPCPKCGGKDRCFVNPKIDRATCRACGWSGDTIQWLRDVEGLSFRDAAERVGKVLDNAPRIMAEPEAPQAVTAPPAKWMDRAAMIASRAQEILWNGDDQAPISWLRSRGLADLTIVRNSLGYCPVDRYERPQSWGLPADHKKVWLPRGIVLPWFVGDQVWRLNIRRPVTAKQVEGGEAKYIGPAGWTNSLYNTGDVKPGKPVVIVEGEIDALLIQQAADDLVTPVATGSTGGARRLRWVIALSKAPTVLVALDNDDDERKGEHAARWWVDALQPLARRWRPYLHDVGDMAQAGLDIRQWIVDGLAT